MYPKKYGCDALLLEFPPLELLAVLLLEITLPDAREQDLDDVVLAALVLQHVVHRFVHVLHRDANAVVLLLLIREALRFGPPLDLVLLMKI